MRTKRRLATVGFLVVVDEVAHLIKGIDELRPKAGKRKKEGQELTERACDWTARLYCSVAL
jgi:hypothetical protein